MSWDDWCSLGTNQSSSERHFQCRCPTGSPCRRQSSTTSISCPVPDWSRSWQALTAQTALPRLLTDTVFIAEPRIKSGSANPAPKLSTLIAGGAHAVARGATLRRKIITVPARLARPQRRPILHLPAHRLWADHWLQLWRNTIGYSPPNAAHTDRRPAGLDRTTQEKRADQRLPIAPIRRTPTVTPPQLHRRSIHGLRLSPFAS